jgi:predicted TIM-barrel fold metal-dependent hydrolase
MPTTVDALALVGPSLFGPGQTAGELLDRMDRAAVDVTVVAAARPPEYALPPANDAVAALQSAHDDRLAGLVRVDPNRPDAAEEVRRGLERGLHGVFLHPREEVFAINDPRVDAVLEVCAARPVPVVVAAGYPFVSEALQVAELAARHPDVPVLMTNGGQLNISGLGQVDALTALRTCPNVLVATNGVYRQDFIEGVVRDVGVDRVVFASAGPQFDPSYEVLRVRLAALADADRAALLGGTATRLFSL